MSAGEGNRPQAVVAPPSRLRSLAEWMPGWGPAAIYALVLLVLWIVSWRVATVGPVAPSSHPHVSFPGDGVAGGWVRFDAAWYLSIAENGYTYVPGQQASVEFFPSYPLAARFVGAVLGSAVLGGIAVTIASALAGVSLFWRWCCERLTREAALSSVLALLLFPYAFFLYGAVYGEALFLLAAIGAFLLVERDRPLLAGLVGIVGSGGRLVGLALVLGLVLRVAERRGAIDGWELHLRRVRPRDLWVLVSCLGTVLYVGYLWHRFDDPLLFAKVQEYWGQSPGLRTWLKVDFFDELWSGDNRRYANGLVLHVLISVGALALLPRIHRRFGLGYAGYTLGVVLFPLVGTSDFHGMGRYVLPAFPAFAAVGELLAESPRARRAVLTGSAAALVVLTGGFARGYWLA